MFFVLQHPFADLRLFVGPASGRLSRPSWPLVEPYSDFIRASGIVLPRRRGGVEEWAGEEVYCRANGAFRFPDQLRTRPLGTPSAPVSAERAFRRFQSAGVVCRLETGLRLDLDGAVSAVTASDVMTLLRNCLELPIRLRGNQGTAALTLVTCGKALAEHYLRATTSYQAGMIQPWWFSCGRPTAILENVSEHSLPVPRHTQRVMETEGISLSHTWLELHNVRCSTWFIEGKNPNRDALRRLRIHLLRLHAERQCLRLVIRYVNEGKLNVQKDQDGSEEVQRYLSNSLRALESTRRFGIDQSPLLDAARDALDVATVGQAASLRHVRRQVAARIDSYIRRAQSTATVVNNIYGDVMNTTIQMGDVTVSGDFNVVTAKNIRESFNKASESDANENLKAKLQELSVQVAKLAAELSPEQAEAVSRDLQALTNEATAKEPRKQWYELSAQGLMDAAKAVAGMAGPVGAAVKAVLALIV